MNESADNSIRLVRRPRWKRMLRTPITLHQHYRVLRRSRLYRRPEALRLALRFVRAGWMWGAK